MRLLISLAAILVPTVASALEGPSRSAPCPYTLQQRTPPATRPPLECLWDSYGRVRAALYPSTDGATQDVAVFEPGRPPRTINVRRISGFDDAPPDVLAQVAGRAPLGIEPPPTPRSHIPPRPAAANATGNLRVIQRTYDNFNRVETETVALETGGSATIRYSYYRNGQRKSTIDAFGRVTFYEYDGKRRLKHVTANQGLPDQHITTYEYWPDDLLKTIFRPNGTVTSYEYDLADRVTGVFIRREGAVLASYEYTYDANGNRRTQIETNGGPPETTSYTYDNLHRLKSVTYPDGRAATYRYDRVGNRIGETERDASGVVVSDKTAVFDAINRLRTITDAVDPSNNATLTYDANGNLRSKTTAAGTAHYDYDPRDLLVETRQGSAITARFAYDGFGRRYLKIGTEGIRQYLYDQTSTLHELDENNLEVAKYEYGAEQLESFIRRDEPRRFYHLDALGSVVALTDATGAVVARYHLDVWGNFRIPSELTASRNRFAFTGYEWDEETGLFNAKARLYDPTIGRFTTQDSFLGEIDTPPSLHRYLYANANPTRYVDPDGHESVLPHLAERDKVGDIAMFKQEVFKADPDRFADGLTDEEGVYLDHFKVQKLDPSRLNEVQIKEARSFFGDNKDAFEQYANYQARSQLITRYALSDPRMVAYLGELYRTSRDLNPAHFVAERVQQVATGAEAFTGDETGRARPAIELALAYGLGKLANSLVTRAVEPGPFDARISTRTASGETSGGAIQIGRGQQIYREGEGLFVRGQQGEFVYAEGRLGAVAAPRDLRAQADLPGKLPGDQAGHALAARFGFTGKQPNLVPMARQLNQSAYKALENRLARLKAQGHDVKMEVWGVPGQNAQRPDRFVVVYTVDGKPVTAVFGNPAPKHQR